MAQRRMFSKKITDTDAFLDMPLSSQALYFHLNMHADDDGFVSNTKTIRRMVGASEDDLKLLITKQFVLAFDDGITVIKDWRIHNYIQKDRYHSTMFADHKSELEIDKNQSYQRLSNVDTKCIQDVHEMDPQVRLGKVRIGKARLYKQDSKLNLPESDKKSKSKKTEKELNSDFEKLWALYPNKKGKKNAFNAYKRAIKKGTTNKEIQDGIVKYKKQIEVQGTDKQYIKQGSTWFNQECWNDEYDTEPTKTKVRVNNYGRKPVEEKMPYWYETDDSETKEKQSSDESTDRAEIEALMKTINEDGANDQ